MVKQKNVENIEKAAELTATFLVPFIFAIVLFIVGVTYNVSSGPTMRYWIVLFNSPFFVFLIIFVMLTWFFMALHYLGVNISSIKFSVLFSVISILVGGILVFFPDVYLPSGVINYSNFFKSDTALIIFVVLAIVVVIYGVLTWWKLSKSQKLSPKP
jgi:uncharacterized membrane protein